MQSVYSVANVRQNVLDKTCSKIEYFFYSQSIVGDLRDIGTCTIMSTYIDTHTFINSASITREIKYEDNIYGGSCCKKYACAILLIVLADIHTYTK